MNRAQRLEADGVTEDSILTFYGQRDKHGWLSNFSAHPIVLAHPFTKQPTVYPTTEHRYQAMKATNAIDHTWVNEAGRPSETKDRGRKIALREGWDEFCWYVMLECLVAKVSQHAAIKRALRETAGLFLYEDSPTDDIWGWRYREDHSGKNLLGKCWMEVRGVLL